MKTRVVLCIVCFAVICGGVIFFLLPFMDADYAVLGYPTYESCEILAEDESARPFDPESDPESWGWREGETIRMRIRLPAAEELPGLYNVEEDGHLSVYPCGADYTFFVDGQEIFRAGQPEIFYSMMPPEIHVTLSPDWAGSELTVLCRPTSLDACSYAGCMFYDSIRTEWSYVFATANSYGIPTGIFALGFILICALFLMSLVLGSPDWSLILLALITGFITVWQISYGQSYFLMPQGAADLFSLPWISLLPLLLMVLYLILNSRRNFWQYFLRTVLITSVAVLAWYGILRLAGSQRALAMETIFSLTMDGYPPMPWILQYFSAICCGIAAFDLVKRVIANREETRAMAVRQTLLTEGYRSMEQSYRETAVLRHEWKNQVAALQLMAEQGAYDKLKNTLSQMDSSLQQLTSASYSNHFIVNVILQNVFARAASVGVEFKAFAPLPKELGIEEADLCSLLINLLNNALEAAARVPEGGKISIMLKVFRSFLVIKCENTYTGELKVDKDGQFSSTKPSSEKHGLGLKQIRNIAAKYSGILDITYTDACFTAQMSLSMREV